MNRREAMAATTAGLTGLGSDAADVPIKPRDPLKITRRENFPVQPHWLFLKVHTNAGLVGFCRPRLGKTPSFRHNRISDPPGREDAKCTFRTS
jgi:hypothetical protein